MQNQWSSCSKHHVTSPKRIHIALEIFVTSIAIHWKKSFLEMWYIFTPYLPSSISFFYLYNTYECITDRQNVFSEEIEAELTYDICLDFHFHRKRKAEITDCCSSPLSPPLSLSISLSLSLSLSLKSETDHPEFTNSEAKYSYKLP